jgi:hypothetical protein
MNAGLQVWSLPRHVPCKGGKTRQLAAKEIKPDHGRVSLSQNGKTRRYHIADELYPTVFPELVERPQLWCRKGHLLSQPIDPEIFGSLKDVVKPRVYRWGTGNRICQWCHNVPVAFGTDNAYSLQYGVAGMPDYSSLPAEPKLLGRLDGDGDREQLAELDWGDHGFEILKSPF